MPPNPSGDDWKEWSQYVLKALDRLTEGYTTIIAQNQKDVQAIRYDVAQLRTEIAMLKIKAGLWGVVGGALPTIAAITILIWKLG